MVLANPEIANLPAWVIALVAAGGLAAALSTAAGLLLVISTAVSNDLIKKTLYPSISEKNELLIARLSATLAVLIAGYFAYNPPDFVAAVVALAFGLAAASIFPAIILGIFFRRGMLVGISVMLFYMMKFKLGWLGDIPPQSEWWFGISPEGFGTIAMLCNFITSFSVSLLFKKPPNHVMDLVDKIRYPK